MNSRPGAATAVKAAARSNTDARERSAGSRRPSVRFDEPKSATRGSRADEGFCPTLALVGHQGFTLALWRMARAAAAANPAAQTTCMRSEEHTSELQSLRHLVCRL